ncbi:MAG: hemolysin family protein [Pseudomonadota bacterium]
MLVFIAAVTLALLISFLCSIMESVLLTVRNSDVEALARKGQPAGTILRGFKNNMDAPIASILIVNTIAHTIGATVAGASYETAIGADSLWLFSIVFTIAVLLLSEIIPKTLGVAYSRQLAIPVAYSIKFLNLALHPLVFVSERISRMLRSEEETPVTSSEEIRLLAILGRKEGAVAEQTAKMIERSTRLGKTQVRDIMLPRQSITFLSRDMSLEQVLDVVHSSGFSRLPVSSSTELDDLIGVVLAKELLLYLRDSAADATNWINLVREPLVFPEHKTLSKALRKFQDSRSHMAIVVNEYGNVDGIVTLEDVIEEVVGNIYDESDTDADKLKRRLDGSIEVNASAELRDICDYLGIEWQPNNEAKSVGGQITELMENLPKEGDRVEWQGYRLTVIEAEPTHVVRVSIRKVLPENKGHDPEESS